MLKSTHFMVLQSTKRILPLPRFFIGYWILKRGWIFILALFYFSEVIAPSVIHFNAAPQTTPEFYIELATGKYFF